MTVGRPQSCLVFALLLGALTPAVEAAENDGFITEALDPTVRHFGQRFQIDLSVFELLEVHPEEWSAPFLAKNGQLVFVGTRTGDLAAFDLGQKRLLWDKREFGDIGRAMEMHGPNLLVGTDSDLVAIEARTGTEAFRVGLDGAVGGAMLVQGNRVIVPIRPNAFVSVDLVTKERVWRVRRPTPEGASVRGQAQATYDAQRKFVYLGFSDGGLMAVDEERGRTEWVQPIGRSQDFFADVDTTPILVSGGAALIVASYNTGLFSLSPDTGQRIWHRPELLHIFGIAKVSERLVVATTGNREVLGIYPANGKVRWRYRFEEGTATVPVVVNSQLIVVGNSQGPIAVLDADTGKPVQTIQPGSGVSVPPCFRNPDLVLLTNKARLLAFQKGLGVSVGGTKIPGIR
jgi:outer membrane protein assembly factor BamB